MIQRQRHAAVEADEAAGTRRGKRRLLRNGKIWDGAAVRKGKKRQHGGKREDDEPEGAASDEWDEDMPAYKDVKYCDERQLSPDCVRGGKREARGEATKKKRGLGITSLHAMSGGELAKWCIEAGFLQDRRGEVCSKCKVLKLELHATKSMYVCAGTQPFASVGLGRGGFELRCVAHSGSELRCLWANESLECTPGNLWRKDK